MREERSALFQQHREQTVLERIVFALGNQVEHARLKHICSGVNVSARRIFGFWLLQKAQHAILIVGLDDAEHAWVFNRRQHDRRRRFAFFVLTNNCF